MNFARECVNIIGMEIQDINENKKAIESVYEIVPHDRLRHVHIVLNRVTHRSFHLHHEFEVIAVLEGEAVIKRSGVELKMSRGDITLINSNEPHEIHTAQEGNGVLIVSLLLSNHLMREYIPRLHNTVFGAVKVGVPSDAGSAIMWNCITGAAKSYITAGSLFELRCISYICGLLEQLIKAIPNEQIDENEYIARKRTSSRMSRIYSYIEEHYQYSLRLAEVADAENVSPTHLSHFFSENFGVSFQKYLNERRLEHALRLLGNLSTSVTDIAAASGFSDPKYLNSVFEKKFRCKLADYRRELYGRQSQTDKPVDSASEQGQERSLTILKEQTEALRSSDWDKL